ncbi:hypothetical protein AB0J86_17850 [Micromonospora sp. NPDC049559]|uniref:hypothetical protein n=1 Tax=Micromonospora sp. NPDC049559 TaxID=3155923 RepID=UPI003449FE5F
MIGVALLLALLAVLAVGLLLLVRRPADPRPLLRRSALLILLLTAALLAPLTVRDSGAAAIFLLGVPVAAAALPLLLPRRTTDLVAGAVVLVWAVLLALGLGFAFLPGAVPLLASGLWPAAPVRAPRP